MVWVHLGLVGKTKGADGGKFQKRPNPWGFRKPTTTTALDFSSSMMRKGQHRQVCLFFFLTLWSHVGLGAGSTLGEPIVFSYELDVPLVAWQHLLGHEQRRNNPGERGTEVQAVWSQGSQLLLPSQHFCPIYFLPPILRHDWQIKIVYNQAVQSAFFFLKAVQSDDLIPMYIVKRVWQSS